MEEVIKLKLILNEKYGEVVYTKPKLLNIATST